MQVRTLIRRSVAPCALLAAGCTGSVDELGTVEGRMQEDLTAQELSALLGMENPAFWSSTTATLSQSTTRTQGQFSLGVQGAGFHFINSVPITAFKLENNSVRVSIRLPTQQPNPFWFGDLQMYADAPSVGLYNQYVGYVGLTGLPLGQFANVNLTLPQNIVQALSGPFNDLVIRITLNVPAGSTGTYLIDNLIFGGVDAADAVGPNVALLPEPTESGTFVFLPLAPPQAGAASTTQFSLNLGIQNNQASAITVNQVTVSFAGGSPPPTQTYAANVAIPAGSFGRFFYQAEQNLFLASPPPTQVTIQAFLQGFASPITSVQPLGAHTPPVAAGAWSWPGYGGELRPGEYWQGRNGAHAPAGDGNQLYALDMGVVGFDGGSWSGLLPGTDGTQNEHYRVFGVPIRAMADGVVQSFRDGDAANTPGGSPCNDGNPTHPACTWVEGNHFYIQHGDELMLYAHMQSGSLSPELTTVGVPVRKGQFLGLSGNSGNSTGPHLHIHTIQGTSRFAGPLRPMPFRNIHVVDTGIATPPSPTTPWSFVNGQGLPQNAANIWPSSTHPNFRPHLVGISRSGDWANVFLTGRTLDAFLDETQELFDEQGLRLVDVTTYEENGVRKWGGISAAGDWANIFTVGLELGPFLTETQRLFDEQGLRLVDIDTYVEGGVQKWSGISRSGDWANIFTVGLELGPFLTETQRLFDEEGLRLIKAITYVEGGVRKWAGISRSGDWANIFTVGLEQAAFLTETQRLFDEEGLRLIDVTSYVDSGVRRYAGISRSGDWANVFLIRNDLDQFIDDTQELFDEDGLRLTHVEIMSQ